MATDTQPLGLIPRIRQRLLASGDANEKRIRRRRRIVSLFTKNLTLVTLTLLSIGYLWMLMLPLPLLTRGVYIDENALQPGQGDTYWDWPDVHLADRLLEKLENLRDNNSSSAERAEFLKVEFAKQGIASSTQNYTFSLSSDTIIGTNAYAMLSSPRSSGSEAMIVSASWLSRTGELNLRGVATVLALSNYLKQYSLWAKDLIFIISDGHLEGMQAWLSAYYGSPQTNLVADNLHINSGVVWTAWNIDYPGHSFSHLGIFFEGLNGRLPNQDLINSVRYISRHAPVVLHDNTEDIIFPSWVPEALRDSQVVRDFSLRAKNVWRQVSYQARGKASGVHGLLHQYRIDAITLFAVPATGPHGFHSLGRVVEGGLRTTNNLLERLHASFFFYFMSNTVSFLKIGSYLPSAILISVAMMFRGLKVWTDAGRIQSVTHEKSPETLWTRRRRPVIKVLSLMAATHILGGMIFLSITSTAFAQNLKVAAPAVFAISAILPTISLRASRDDGRTTTIAPYPMVLKALNLCFASTVISIITVLNFSLAATLAVFLAIPLSISSSSQQQQLRWVKYIAYISLGFGWLLFAQDELRQAIWNWEMLGVWFAPLVCLVYIPLTIQAALVCLLPW